MIRRVAATAVAAVLLLASPVPAQADPLLFPVRVDDGFPYPGPPQVSAASWLLYDSSSDLVLASFSPSQERAIASITKIMTGLLVLERADLDDLVTVSANAADIGEREIGLVAGEQLTMEALFKALMIHSANDAAIAIAEHMAGSVSGFVKLMNDRAEELGLTGTHFANPHGLDAPGHHSTAQDLLDLTLVAMSHPQFVDAVRSRAVSFPPAPDGTGRRGGTTNLLLGAYDGNMGVKTGFTNEAQLTFVASTERDGRRLYLVLLGSEGPRAHFADATALFDYGFAELGVFGTLSLGQRFDSMMLRAGPDPAVASAHAESLIHITSLGVIEAPAPPDPVEDQPPPRIVLTTRRHPEPPPPSLAEALGFWWRQLSDR